jgi:hypothetical protein
MNFSNLVFLLNLVQPKRNCDILTHRSVLYKLTKFEGMLERGDSPLKTIIEFIFFKTDIRLLLFRRNTKQLTIDPICKIGLGSGSG